MLVLFAGQGKENQHINSSDLHNNKDRQLTHRACLMSRLRTERQDPF